MLHAQSTSTNSAGNNNNSSAHVRRHLCQMEARIAQRRAFDRHVAILHSEAAAHSCAILGHRTVGQWGSENLLTAFTGYSLCRRQPRVYCRVKGFVAGVGYRGSLTTSAPGERTSRLPHGSCGRAPEPYRGKPHPSQVSWTHIMPLRLHLTPSCARTRSPTHAASAPSPTSTAAATAGTPSL